jgi:dTDP-4-dehydrorhamnose reductase
MGKRKRILVLGANGLLGTMFRENYSINHDWVFVVRGEDDKKNTTDLAFDCSTTDINQWTELLNGFNIVINCAAVTKVDLIETDIDEATKSHLVNFRAVEALSKACLLENVTLIHFSTDYVFNGVTNRPYFETDTTSPINAYGRDKMRGEVAVRESGCKYLIFRTSWVYSHNDGNFFTKTIEMIDSHKQLFIFGVTDIISSPTNAYDLSMAIIQIIDTNQEHKIGIYHYTNEGVCTRYDFIKVIAEQHDCMLDKIQPVHNDYFQCVARRPYCSVLSKQHFTNTFGILIPHWIESLKDCYVRYKNKD